MYRLLTIGHSYVVDANRCLAHEMQAQGRGRWEVTVGAPERLAGELGDLRLRVDPSEPCEVAALGVHLGRSPHLRFYDRRLRRLLARSWDVVHVWQEPYVLAAAQIARAASPSARIVPATFQNIRKRYPAPVRRLERRVMERAAGWIAFGRTAHEALAVEPPFSTRPCRVIPPGVDLRRFHPDQSSRAAVRARAGWHDDRPVVGFLGRFVPEKGLRVMLQALALLRRPWRAMFVGGGPLERELREFSTAHPGRVRVITDAGHGAVPAHLNAMDVLCAPSQTTARWREQFGRMLIEAMACGVPVVASRSGEVPHVVGDGGMLVSESDTAAWTVALESLLADPALRRELAAGGLRRAREHYAWPVIARAHLDFFEELLDGHGGSCAG
ncbi:MAG TPA: glycosyltransferase family 4 protein [Vicinamibacterales bacterium]|nr:glycosyltransferase family 4 protein [Vicinamibacterales bacterium]